MVTLDFTTLFHPTSNYFRYAWAKDHGHSATIQNIRIYSMPATAVRMLPSTKTDSHPGSAKVPRLSLAKCGKLGYVHLE